MKTWNRNRMADCHPDRKHAAKGMCRQCYSVQNARNWRKNNRQKSISRLLKWQTDNPDRAKSTRNEGSQKRRTNRQELAAGRKKPVVCEVCGYGGTICWDHDHRTGRFRGWLCSHCNTVLGRVRDSSEQLRLLANYLDAGGFGSGPHVSRTLNERELVQK